MIGNGTGMKPAFMLSLVLLSLVALVGSCTYLLRWHSTQLDSSYALGYRTAQLEYAAEVGKKSAQGVQSARVERATRDRTVQAVQEKANEVQRATPSPVCSFTEYDLGLLNGTIEVGNSGLRVHGSAGVSGTGEVH
jgi:hypothetical protein